MTHLERFLKGETQCIDFANKDRELLHWFLGVIINNTSEIDASNFEFTENRFNAMYCEGGEISVLSSPIGYSDYPKVPFDWLCTDALKLEKENKPVVCIFKANVMRDGEKGVYSEGFKEMKNIDEFFKWIGTLEEKGFLVLNYDLIR